MLQDDYVLGLLGNDVLQVGLVGERESEGRVEAAEISLRIHETATRGRADLHEAARVRPLVLQAAMAKGKKGVLQGHLCQGALRAKTCCPECELATA